MYHQCEFTRALNKLHAGFAVTSLSRLDSIRKFSLENVTCSSFLRSNKVVWNFFVRRLCHVFRILWLIFRLIRSWIMTGLWSERGKVFLFFFFWASGLVAGSCDRGGGDFYDIGCVMIWWWLEFFEKFSFLDSLIWKGRHEV